ncbi:rhodanese-like domain-containing protein [Pseudokineococcus lusitanus]|uniref:Rhodanese-related sulfurtransferase n=1 Tax=Pseudokineococcus lusitanus TaxID=763993 RepID=A0A3N1HQC2_9ACTN|nr:rhodanese-like domain-containing protein [Pseudokineococcus lusitanus]ROP44691.1 rhodanese-related sulfurtransferase [Pseudokineococcus lusitanus]
MSTTTVRPAAATSAAAPVPGGEPRRVPVADVADRLQGGTAPTLIDVRTPAEHETAHVTGSHNVPLNLLGDHAREIAGRLGDGDVVLLCQSGARAQQAAKLLTAAGLEAARVQVLDGGVDALGAAGAPVVRGRQRWAMDRQVRLAAGSVVLASIVASIAAPATRFVAGGIGLGLTASALSGTCPMARGLALLPYNRGPAARSPRQVIDSLPRR